jgi:hypothetical protein
MKQETTRSSAPRPQRRGGWFLSRAHFLLRFLGLTGFFAAVVGLVLVGYSIANFFSWSDVPYNELSRGVRGQIFPLQSTADYGLFCILWGTGAALLALLIEVVMVLFFVAARRSAIGFNAALQIALAAVLLVGVNVVAFLHPERVDCTRAQQFTLPKSIENDLRKLQGETTLFVLVRPKEKEGAEKKVHYSESDELESAAQTKVVEMVEDLAEQFRQVGPQFRVVVLKTNEKGYSANLDKATKDATRKAKEPEKDAKKLRDALEGAAESSIFFYQDGKVQQLGFNEFVQLDKPASLESGNLKLLIQGASGRGVEPLARKILHIEERRPRVGILVVHELLTTESTVDVFTLKGLRKALAAHGFDVRDVVLKKNWEQGGPPEPAADTLEESKLERVENELDDLDDEIKTLEEEAKIFRAIIDDWTVKPGEDEDRQLDRLSQKYATQLRGRRVTPALRKVQVEMLQSVLNGRQEDLVEAKREREDKRKEREQLDTEGVAEGRRLSDVQGKLKRVLADCDVLFIPRITRNSSVLISNRVHRLEEQQIAAIKEFLKAGKPVFACLGPTNEPRDSAERERDDDLEKMFAELGIRLGSQTVLFNADAKAFADRRPTPFTSSGDENVPPVDFDSSTQAVTGRWLTVDAAAAQQPNPLRDSMRVTAHSAGKDFDLRVHFPRPVFYDPVKPWLPPMEAASGIGLLGAPLNAGPLALATALPRKARTDAVFLATGYHDGTQPWSQPAQIAGTIGVLACAPVNGPLAAVAGLPRTRTDPTFLLSGVGWNDSNPFPERGRRPRYEPPKPDDPANGTLEEKRRGAFPIGVAVETTLPSDWTGGVPTKARVAVIGQGDVFTGNELSPPREQLALQTLNWLLGRDEYLPRAEHPWSYPRIALTKTEQALWWWGGCVGLPVAFFYLGVVVLLARRVR